MYKLLYKLFGISPLLMQTTWQRPNCHPRCERGSRLGPSLVRNVKHQVDESGIGERRKLQDDVTGLGNDGGSDLEYFASASASASAGLAQ